MGPGELDRGLLPRRSRGHCYGPTDGTRGRCARHTGRRAEPDAQFDQACAGGWPTQKEAPGKELALLVPVQDQLQDLPGVDAVQLPVEFLLPDKYMARIRYQYKDLVAALNEPWLQNDATRQMLIASILTTWQRPRTVMRANRSSTLLVTRSTKATTQPWSVVPRRTT